MLKRVLCLKEFIKLCADQIPICKPEDQKIVWPEDQRIICRSKNLVIKKVFSLKVEELSADQRTVCKSFKELSADWRIILRLKNYLQIEKFGDRRNFQSWDWRIMCRYFWELKEKLYQKAGFLKFHAKFEKRDLPCTQSFDLQIISQSADSSSICRLNTSSTWG